VLLALASFGIVIVIASPSRADPGDACVSSYEDAQRAKQAGELVRSEANLRLCLGACPTALAADCERWLGDVANGIARVTLEAQFADGRSAAGVTLTVDGIARALDVALELDPGPHQLHLDGATIVPKTETWTATAGMTARHVLLVKARPSTGGVTPTEREPPSVLGPVVLGGAGLLALATAGVLTIIGHLDVSDMRDTCAPDCDPQRVDRVRAMWTAGGILAAAGGATLIGSGVWLGLTLAPPIGDEARAVGNVTIAF